MFYAESLCFLLLTILVEVLGTVKMGGNMFYLLLVINTDSLKNFTLKWIGMERRYSLTVMKERKIRDDLK